MNKRNTQISLELWSRNEWIFHKKITFGGLVSVFCLWWILINVSVFLNMCLWKNHHQNLCVYECLFFDISANHLVTHLKQWIIISTLDFFYLFYTKGVIYVVNDTICCCRGIFLCYICSICLVCVVSENSLSLLFVGLDYDVNLCAFDWDYCKGLLGVSVKTDCVISK